MASCRKLGRGIIVRIFPKTRSNFWISKHFCDVKDKLSNSAYVLSSLHKNAFNSQLISKPQLQLIGYLMNSINCNKFQLFVCIVIHKMDSILQKDATLHIFILRFFLLKKNCYFMTFFLLEIWFIKKLAFLFFIYLFFIFPINGNSKKIFFQRNRIFV